MAGFLKATVRLNRSDITDVIQVSTETSACMAGPKFVRALEKSSITSYS